MKLAYFYPAKIVFANYSGTPEPIPCSYATLAKLPGNVYFDTKKGRIVTDGKEHAFSVFALYGSTWIFLRQFSPEFDLSAWVERMNETLPGLLAENSAFINNPSAYEAKQAEKRETARIQREESEKAIAERKAQAAREEAERFGKAVESFDAGEPISWDDFETACKARGIAIPIGTMGWGRKNVSTISKASYSLKSGNRSSVIFDYIKMLSEALSVVA